MQEWTDGVRLVGEKTFNLTRYCGSQIRRAFVAAAYYSTIWPLRHLYFHGPSINGWAFWQSKEHADACAELTGISHHHWQHNEDACAQLLDKKFDAFKVGVAFFIYASFILFFIWALLIRCILIRPLLCAFQK